MILEDGQAPWEHPATAETFLKPLGNARRVILGLLHRDPARRLNMTQCVQACESIVGAPSAAPGTAPSCTARSPPVRNHTVSALMAESTATEASAEASTEACASHAGHEGGRDMYPAFVQCPSSFGTGMGPCMGGGVTLR